MKLADVLSEIDRGELALARVVFANDEHAAMRERVAERIEARLQASHEEGSYAFLHAVAKDDGLPALLRTSAGNHIFLLDQRPAGPDHRAFLRVHGVKSIDDIDD